jgi:hypothetical protein
MLVQRKGSGMSSPSSLIAHSTCQPSEIEIGVRERGIRLGKSPKGTQSFGHSVSLRPQRSTPCNSHLASTHHYQLTAARGRRAGPDQVGDHPVDDWVI